MKIGVPTLWSYNQLYKKSQSNFNLFSITSLADYFHKLHSPLQPFWIEAYHVGELHGLEVGNCPQKLCRNLSVNHKQDLVSNGALKKMHGELGKYSTHYPGEWVHCESQQMSKMCDASNPEIMAI